MQISLAVESVYDKTFALCHLSNERFCYKQSLSRKTSLLLQTMPNLSKNEIRTRKILTFLSTSPEPYVTFI